MHDPGLSLSPLASEFLTMLQAVSEANGFAVNTPEDAVFSSDWRWEAQLEVRGPLGSFTMKLWTTWVMLRCSEASCYLELSSNEGAPFVSYNCVDIPDLTQSIEFVTLLAQHAPTRVWMMKALRLDADPEWQARERPRVIALLRERGTASDVVAPSAKKVLA